MRRHNATHRLGLSPRSVSVEGERCVGSCRSLFKRLEFNEEREEEEGGGKEEQQQHEEGLMT